MIHADRVARRDPDHRDPRRDRDPVVLARKSKATDAAAKELAHSAQIPAETIDTDNSGSYATVTPTALNTSGTTIHVGSAGGNAYIAPVTSGPTTYTISRAANGSISRTGKQARNLDRRRHGGALEVDAPLFTFDGTRHVHPCTASQTFLQLHPTGSCDGGCAASAAGRRRGPGDGA